MGSGAERHDELAAPLGRWIAVRGYHLLTGGGGGVMEAVSEAFASVRARRGLVIGVLKGRPDAEGFVVGSPPNRWVEVPVRTHLPLSGSEGTDLRSRNHINVLTADLVVGLPGGDGTRSEMELAVRYGRPVIAFVGATERPPGWPAIPLAATLEEFERLAVLLLEPARGTRAHPSR